MSESGAHRLGNPPDAPAAAGPSIPTAPPAAPIEDLSLGDLMGRMTSDLSTLLRQEVALAKVELKEEATKAGKGAGLFGGTAFAGYLAIVLLSFAAAWGLAEVMAVGFAFLIVGGLYALVAAVLFVAGRKKMRSVRGPERTVQTLKEDAQWAHERMS